MTQAATDIETLRAQILAKISPVPFARRISVESGPGDTIFVTGIIPFNYSSEDRAEARRQSREAAVHIQRALNDEPLLMETFLIYGETVPGQSNQMKFELIYAIRGGKAWQREQEIIQRDPGRGSR